jgi:hypothetical protein
MSKELATVESNLPVRRNEGSRNDGTLIMEDARIVFRNFAGAEGMYNREGDRNFCVLLEEDLAQDMIADGWNIKRLKPRDDAPIGTAYIQVSVGFKGKRGGPRMVMITSKGKIELGEDECILLDWADIKIADLIIRPYHWNVSGKSGIKAYLKTIFITINEDYLELKYDDVPAVEMNARDSENNIKAIEATSAALSAAVNSDQDAGALTDDGQDDIVDAEWTEED